MCFFYLFPAVPTGFARICRKRGQNAYNIAASDSAKLFPFCLACMNPYSRGKLHFEKDLNLNFPELFLGIVLCFYSAPGMQYSFNIEHLKKIKILSVFTCFCYYLTLLV